MNTLISLACCLLFGLAGRFLYRNPVKVLDAVFKEYDLQYGRVTVGFYRGFGATMIVLAVLGAIMTVTVAVFEIFH